EDPLLARIARMIREEVDPSFDFLEPGPIPWSAATSGLASRPIALVTTSGLHRKGDDPFRALEDRLGDTPFRIVPQGTTAEQLDLTAVYVDARHIPQDPEVALPMRALAAMHADGQSGPPAARHYSFSGGIIRPLPGLTRSAERILELMSDDGVG